LEGFSGTEEATRAFLQGGALGEERTGGERIKTRFERETGTGNDEGGKVIAATSSKAASSLELDSDSTTGGEITGARLRQRRVFDLEVDTTGAGAGALSESDSS